MDARAAAAVALITGFVAPHFCNRRLEAFGQASKILAAPEGHLTTFEPIAERPSLAVGEKVGFQGMGLVSPRIVSLVSCTTAW